MDCCSVSLLGSLQNIENPVSQHIDDGVLVESSMGYGEVVCCAGTVVDDASSSTVGAFVVDIIVT